MNRPIATNSKLASTVRHSFGYLPAVLLKAIIEDNINIDNNENTPSIFSIKTCCLYIDITKLFENSSSNLNANESTKTTPFNYTKNLYIPEYYYFFFNRFQEKLISCITNHGGDIIFQGLGAYAIWPHEEIEDEDENREKMVNIDLRTIQCALDLQKKALKSDFSNKSLFFPKIGISYGYCKFIILKSFDGKYEYTAYGDALLEAFECSQKVVKKGQIITNRKMFEDISKYLDYSNIGEDSSYLSINALKNVGTLLQNNKSTVNLIRNNFSLEQLLNKKNILTNFANHIDSDNFHNSSLDEKWFKEIRYMTLLFVRIKMSQDDYEKPEQIQKNFIIIKTISTKYGGIINKILTDKDGFIYQIAFGIKRFKNSENEIRGVLAAFEICKKLKQKKIIPYIGISSGLSFYGLIGTLGGRREIFVISGLLFFSFLSMEKAQEMNEHKTDKFEDDNILIDESTMIMIDYKIPSKFYKKLPSRLGIDINLFTPTKINSLLNEHYVSNLFPLIGTHLHEKEDSSYENNIILGKEDNIIFLEEENMRNIVKIMNDFTFNRTDIKLININSIWGCGKTLLLKKCLDNYFEGNPKLKETLIIHNNVKEYPFIFNANLTYVMNSDILINNNKEDYRGLQYILKTMYDLINKEDDIKKKMRKIFNQNKEIEDYLKKIILFDNDKDQPEKVYNDFNSFKEDSCLLSNENKKKIHQIFINIIKDYKKIMNNAYRDVIYETKYQMPLIIIIDDVNICDNLTIEFIKYYLSNECNDLLFITLNSIPIYPPYVYLEPVQKDPFCDLKDNKSIAKFSIELLDTDDKKIIFVKSVLKELKGINISSISPKMLKFLVNKTFGGNQFILMRIILTIIEQNYYIIENEILKENENFEKMLKYNDFTELILSRIIQKKIGEIIGNILDEEEVVLLKIASLFGDLFEISQLKQVILIENTSIFVSYLKKGDDYYIYKKLKGLESKYIIEIIEDLDFKNKYVICKFSIPFLREILYQRIPSEQRNQLHYIIGKMTKINFHSNYGKRSRYLSNEDELEMLKNHLKFSEITIHENFLKGTLSNSEIVNDNLNINNLKILLTQAICSKISSIKVNDDKNNMIKAGYIYKKSDGKLTWENRYFVLTTNRVVYYYNDEDYKKEEVPPLGIFYLQNLFSVNLLTDGYVGGKKNIFSLSVNEWIKKGNYMTPRIYYLSIEDREELYKWIITFNILKIKAFYDSYSQNFGYVHFPLYNRNKNENNFKPKKNTQFDYELYNEIYKKVSEQKLINPKKDSDETVIYNKYFLRDENESKKEDDLKFNNLTKEMLSRFKFLSKYALPIFLSNIQLSLKKNQNKFNKLVPNSLSELEFKTPKYILSLKDNYLKEEIGTLEEKLKNINKKPIGKKIAFTNREKKYFNQFYNNIIHPKENQIHFKIKNIKKYLAGKKIEKTKYKLFGKESKKVNIKKEWQRYFEEDQNFFKNCQEEKIDTTDNLRYTDFIDKYDVYGNLKERTSLMYRQSISSKIDPNKNLNENPILGTLLSRQKNKEDEDDETDENGMIPKKNSEGSLVEENIKENDKENNKSNEKDNELIQEKNRNEIKEMNEEELEDVNKETNKNNDSLKNKDNEKKEKENEKKEEDKKEKKSNKNKNEKNNKTKKKKSKENDSKDTLEKKEILKKTKKDVKDSKLLDLISDKNKNKKENISEIKEDNIKTNNFDFAKAVKKTNEITNKKIGNAIIISDSSSEESPKGNVDLNINNGNTNSLFSFGDNNNAIGINNQGIKAKNINNSFNYQDSSLVNSSKSVENDSNKFINSNYDSNKSNENESLSNEDDNNSNNENDLLSFKNKSKDISNKKVNELSFNSNNNKKSNKNTNSHNLNSMNTEKLSENNENNKINENKMKNASKNSLNSDSKQQINSKYDYLNELSPNRRYIINIKLNHINKEKNKLEKINNTLSEINSNNNQTEFEAFDKLRDINLSLDNEKSLSAYFKRINKENAIQENNKNKTKKSSKYSQEMTIQSTNSNYDNIFYPSVYYINEDCNLHSKTHVSMLFSNLKNQINIYNQEQNN